MKAIVFTGGRNYTNTTQFLSTLHMLPKSFLWRPFVGCATGLDALVREYLPHRLEFKAEWSRGKIAGPLRNGKMLREAVELVKGDLSEILVLAFPGGPGTANCIRQARDMGLTVFRVEL